MATIQCRPGYEAILVESFYSYEAGHRYPIEIRPLPDQIHSTDLLVECAMEMREQYPVGTVFRICVTRKQKVGCRPHLYSYYRWPFEVVKTPRVP